MVRFVRFAVVAFFLVSSSLASAIDIELGPSDFSRIGSGPAVDTASGVRHSYGHTVRFPGGRIPDFNVTRNQLIPRAGVVSGLKDLVRVNPGAVAGTAALTALLAGIDWVLDPANNSLTKPAGSIYSGAPGVSVVYSGVFVNCAYAATVTPPVIIHNGPGNYMYYVNSVGSFPAGWTYNSNCSSTRKIASKLYDGLIVDGRSDVVDADWSDMVDHFATLPASAVASTAGILIGAGIDPADMSISDGVIDGPVTIVGDTSTSTSTGPDGTTVTNETTSFHMSYGPTSVSNTGSTTNTETYVNGNLTTSTTTNTTNNSGTTTNNQYNSGGAWIPTDCDFMPTVCQFLEWFKTPAAMPDPEFPQVGEFEDTSGDFNVDFGGSCPEPYLIELALFPPVSFSWQPLCSFAGYMQPMVIISALIFAAYITLGISRGNS